MHLPCEVWMQFKMKQVFYGSEKSLRSSTGYLIKCLFGTMRSFPPCLPLIFKKNPGSWSSCTGTQNDFLDLSLSLDMLFRLVFLYWNNFVPLNMIGLLKDSHDMTNLEWVDVCQYGKPQLWC